MGSLLSKLYNPFYTHSHIISIGSYLGHSMIGMGICIVSMLELFDMFIYKCQKDIPKYSIPLET